MGAAPSHTAQALMPLFQKPFTSPAPGKSSLFATAPVLWRLPLMYCREDVLLLHSWICCDSFGAKAFVRARRFPLTCCYDDSLCLYSLLVSPDLEGSPREVYFGDSL